MCLFPAVEPFKEGQLSELIVKKLLNQDVIHSIKPRNKDNPKADLHSYIYTQVGGEAAPSVTFYKPQGLRW